MKSMRMSSPLGELLALDDSGHLYGLYFTDSKDCPDLEGRVWASSPLLDALEKWLYGYFRGESIAFDGPLAPRGTPFQWRVWSTLKEVGYGQAVSYGELAKAVGSPKAARAIGGAVGSNPWVIVVPCHRVLGSGHHLGGFSSGLERKRTLLSLEGISWREP